MEKPYRLYPAFTPKNQADRIKDIQNKLSVITEAKSAHLRQEKSTSLQSRAVNIQKTATQSIRKYQSQIRQQKQNLKELVRQYDERKSEKEIILKNRTSEINELQNTISSVWKTEINKTKQSQKKLMISFQQKINCLKLEFDREVEKRKQYFVNLDQRLTDNLPGLQAEIIQRMETSSKRLKEIENQIQKQAQVACKKIKDAQRKQIASFQQLMKMISSIIAEVKQEICDQRQNRLLSKQKIISLFEQASQKLIT